MKQVSFILLLLGLLGYFGYEMYYGQNNLEEGIHNEIKVLLIYNKNENSDILKAYESVLEEEGVPFELISNEKLIKLSPDTIYMNVPAIIFPESVNQHIANSTDYWIEKYVKSGGKVALIYDVDTRSKDGKYKLSSTYLDRVLGLNFTVYQQKKDQSYKSGNIYFRDQQTARYFEMPTGKIDENCSIVGYQYGKLFYPISPVKVISNEGQKIYATDGKKRPVIVKKDVGEGSLLYVGTPLGYLKGKSDDLILRSILKTFLFKIAYVPHLVSSPNAKGTLVINWHVDSSIEHLTLPWMLEHNYFRDDLVQSIHITAGPDCDDFGDGLGFDAKGKGYLLVKQIMKYGKIGSHGGWAHNWYAKNIEENNFTIDDMKQYIQMNNAALESIVGYKMTEYSAPVGTFPPDPSVKIMEELGVKGYYYVGDSGSAPNRTFFEQKMLSSNVVAFPVMTFGKNASFYEMNASKWSEEKVEKAYKELVDYVVINRSIRLYYGHPYDIHDYAYKTAEKNFLDYISSMQKEGKLQTRTMTDMAEFVLRVANAEKKFILEKDKLHMEIKNRNGLKDLAIAVPKEIFGNKIRNQGFKEDTYYYYVSLKGDTNQTVMDFNFE